MNAPDFEPDWDIVETKPKEFWWPLVMWILIGINVVLFVILQLLRME